MGFGGRASCRRPWRGEKEEPPGESKGKDEPGPQLCPSECRLAGFHAYAAPAESARPGTPSVCERREEEQALRDCGVDTEEAGDTTRKLSARGERTAPCTTPRAPQLAPGALLPAARAPRLACVRNRLHLARAAGTVELESRGAGVATELVQQSAGRAP